MQVARALRRLIGAAVVLTVTVGWSTTTFAVPSQTGGDRETGLSASSMNVAFVYGDTSNLQQAGVIAKIGDVGKDFQVFADAANTAGAAGRQLNVSLERYQIPSTATDERPACVAATEDDDAFIVVFLGGQTDESLLCSAEEHKRITLVIDATARPDTFTAAKGLLYTNSMSAARLMKAWAAAVKEEGLLKGKTIGIVRPSDSAHEEVAKALKAALKKANADVAEEVALPCTAVQSCSQSDVAAERLQTKGVDTVFSLLPAIPYPSFVQAAAAIGYQPQWLSSDYENQVLDTTAKLFGDAKTEYDGAIGISTAVADRKPDAPRTKCNDEFTQATDITYEPLTDAWRAVGTACSLVDRIVHAANAAEQGGGLTQKRFLAEYQSFPVVEGKRKGAFGPKKFDAVDTYQLFKFSAACTCWKPINGTSGLFQG